MSTHIFSIILEYIETVKQKKTFIIINSDLEEKLLCRCVLLLPFSVLSRESCQSVSDLLTCPSPPPLTILLQSLVPAMAVTPVLCAL